MTQLSVLIPARNEEWLNRTVADVLAHAKADTEVIVVLDGVWPVEPLQQHPRLKVIYVPQAIGQRAGTNLAARLSSATYLMKLDAHCAVADGFDVELIKTAGELEPNVIQIPAQKNLHVYDWVCEACGKREYQRALPACRVCKSTQLRREVVWGLKRGVHTYRWRFDAELRFQYWNGGPKDELVETMSCLGACWFIRRDQHWALEGLDEGHGSWGQVGTELACKAWLSGGRMVTNRRTWFAHFFRVGGQTVPYPLTAQQQEKAREYSRDLWQGNKWPGQIRPLRWLVDKFWPVPGWMEKERDGLSGELRPDHRGDRRSERPGADHRGGGFEPIGCDPHHRSARPSPGSGTTGIVYYSDCLPEDVILEASRRTIERSGLPIAAVTLKPIDWPSARYITLDLERGYLTMFRQILAGLEALDTDIAFLCEHDVLYHRSHFAFRPPNRTQVFYNQHVWKVDAQTGRALHYRCSQTSGLCADRQLLVEHYRTRVAMVETNGFSRQMGFEPGTHRREARVDDLTAGTWMSEYPNVDIRHGQNLTPSRWKRDQFRNQKYTEGWTESDSVPGWGPVRGLLERMRHGAQQAVA